MDGYWESAMNVAGYNYEAGPIDIEPEWFSQLTESLTLLGKVYKTPIDNRALLQDIRTRLYCTYRRSFLPIGDPSGPTSDQGWGCMHRCGQMMLAQALLMTHLGRDWNWFPNEHDPVYAKIENMFHDIRDANYSIHKITNMGMAEGKKIGEWFGPNTVAQVIRKLSIHEDWTNLLVHVAMEEGVIIDELKAKCLSVPSQNLDAPSFKSFEWSDGNSMLVKDHQTLEQRIISSDCIEIVKVPLTISNTHLTTELNDFANFQSFPKASNSSNPGSDYWRPLLLIVPLRLGLNKTNAQYIPALKKCLEMPQSVGILGGWPRHALWIIGYFDDHLIYLDPHTTQPAVTVSANECTDQGQNIYPESSQTYHTIRAGRLSIDQLDPSVAVGFVCTSQQSFDHLCANLRRPVLQSCSMEPLFEIHTSRPPGLCIPTNSFASASDKFSMSNQDSDSDFEII